MMPLIPALNGASSASPSPLRNPPILPGKLRNQFSTGVTTPLWK